MGAALLLIGSLALYVFVAAGIGLWCSTLPGTQLQANFRAVLGVLLVNGFPCVAANHIQNLLSGQLYPSAIDWIQSLLAFGFTPIATLLVLAFSYDGVLNPTGIATPRNVQSALIGLFAYALFAALFWRRVVATFMQASDPSWKRDRRRALAASRL